MVRRGNSATQSSRRLAAGLFTGIWNGLAGNMSIRCLFGSHRPSVTSVARKGSGYVALCEGCARPLERSREGRWAASEPLDARVGGRA